MDSSISAGKVSNEEVVNMLNKIKSLPLSGERLSEVLHVHDPIYEGRVDFQVRIIHTKSLHSKFDNIGKH